MGGLTRGGVDLFQEKRYSEKVDAEPPLLKARLLELFGCRDNSLFQRFEGGYDFRGSGGMFFGNFLKSVCSFGSGPIL